MRRQQRQPVLDFNIPGDNIPGDELERSRIQLENNLQQTELSLRASSTTEDDEDDLHYRRHPHRARSTHYTTGQGQTRHRAGSSSSLGRPKLTSHQSSYHNSSSSIEYGRHNSEPELFHDFGSFTGRSRDHHDPYDHSIDPHGNSQQGWSYHPTDDDVGAGNAGETMSTAAHHASQLTLSAGLTGRVGRREPSLSGAEYDPDRPVQDMIAGVNSKFSLFDIDSSRSRQSTVGGLSLAPVVIDVDSDNADELDRVLQSGLAPPPATSLGRTTRLRSSHSSSSSSDTESLSDINHSANTQANTHANAAIAATASPNVSNLNMNTSINRPKLSDAMRRVSFSPVRQRGSPAAAADAVKEGRTRYNPTSPLSRHVLKAGSDATLGATRGRRGSGGSAASGGAGAGAPLNPPAQTRFSKTVRAVSQDGEAELDRFDRERERDRNLFHDAQNSPRLPGPSAKQPTPRKSSLKNANRPGYVPATANPTNLNAHSKVFLPDVTGLTNVIDSPMKFGGEYMGYKGDAGMRESEGRLVRTLNAVQSKLLRLEEENSISRRKVTELERELDDCKREMSRERRGEREESLASIRRADLGGPSRKSGGNVKGKGKAVGGGGVFGRVGWDEGRSSDRFDEFNLEKKALEELIYELRSHLSRLSVELSSHQQLLSELRRLRDLDVGKLQEKSEEIAMLKSQVEKLEGEVEVLRTTVEEGIQRVRERSVSLDGPLIGDDHARQREEGAAAAAGAAEHEHEHEQEEEEEHQQGMPDEDSYEYKAIPERQIVQQIGEFDDPPTPRRHVPAADQTHQATLGGDTIPAIVTSTPVHDDESDEDVVRPAGARQGGRNEGDDNSRQLNASVLDRVSLSLTRSFSSSEDEDDGGADSPTPPPTRIGQAHGLRRHHHRRGSGSGDANAGKGKGQTRSGSGAGAGAGGERNEPVEQPFPQIRGKHLEELFFSAPEHNEENCRVCRRGRRNNYGTSAIVDAHDDSHPRRKASKAGEANLKARGLKLGAGNVVLENEGDVSAVGAGKLLPSSREREYWRNLEEARRAGPSRPRARGYHDVDDEGEETEREDKGDAEDEGFAEGDGYAHRRSAGKSKPGDGMLEMEQPPQTMVQNVIEELQDDLVHYKSIFIELTDQYKLMDPVSDVRRRNVLAQHIKEVIDILEQKANQIAALTKLLKYQDQAPPSWNNVKRTASSSSQPLEPRRPQPAALRRHPTYA
ncbi:hypothetical protein AX16_006095 [Volvariella volvacea WC 439]|nr:hypothetical protein AX16_006095 [Volvariella volvacea WC 439]